MPNYDIIPMAADLLDYTIQRVKTVEPVSAYVMENGKVIRKLRHSSIKRMRARVQNILKEVIQWLQPPWAVKRQEVLLRLKKMVFW